MAKSSHSPVTSVGREQSEGIEKRKLLCEFTWEECLLMNYSKHIRGPREPSPGLRSIVFDSELSSLVTIVKWSQPAVLSPNKDERNPQETLRSYTCALQLLISETQTRQKESHRFNKSWFIKISWDYGMSTFKLVKDLFYLWFG